MEHTTLEYGKYYHIYTHAVGERNLFSEPENYEYFLHLYGKYIEPVAKTFAWALMPNHLHLLIRFKNLSELTGFQDRSDLKLPHQHFSNLFNAYTKAFNKWKDTRGTLFERPFHRKKIENLTHLKNVVLYIHNNPVHHRFCEHPLEYPWTSYLSCITLKPTKLQRETVVGWFDNEAKFKLKHGNTINYTDLEKWLGLL